MCTDGLKAQRIKGIKTRNSPLEGGKGDVNDKQNKLYILLLVTGGWGSQ